MLKIFFLGMLGFSSMENSTENTNLKMADDNVCRITCTINVPDGFGGTIGISATAGNFWTNCEDAGKKACQKATLRAMNALFDAN